MTHFAEKRNEIVHRGIHNGGEMVPRRAIGWGKVIASGGQSMFTLPRYVCIDEPLLQALLQAQGVETRDRLWEAIVSFNLANTDNIEMTEQVEAVLLTGAFERLLDCGHGTEDELAERFAHILAPTDDLAPSTYTRLSGPDIVNRFKQSPTIRTMWIRDFFRLRGDLEPR
jgi:hypothetical protein